MKRFNTILAIFFTLVVMLFAATLVNAQVRETYTGTVVYFGSGVNAQNISAQFTLTLNGYTSEEEAERYLKVLKNDGQDALLEAIDDKTIGRFSVGANVGVPVNVARTKIVDGKRKIFVIFERWTQFAELRYGYRSLDYPFGYIEIVLDERTGKGEGTYIAAAKIRWDSYDAEDDITQIEVENFATFPARLLGVQKSADRLP